jgi:hypothetical protein
MKVWVAPFFSWQRSQHPGTLPSNMNIPRTFKKDGSWERSNLQTTRIPCKPISGLYFAVAYITRFYNCLQSKMER